MAETVTPLPNVAVILSNGATETFDVPPDHVAVTWGKDKGSLTVHGAKQRDDGTLYSGMLMGEFAPGSWLAVRRY